MVLNLNKVFVKFAAKGRPFLISLKNTDFERKNYLNAVFSFCAGQIYGQKIIPATFF